MSAWPQFVLLGLMVLSDGISLGRHGLPRGNHNFFMGALGTCITTFLLYEGGFFTILGWSP